MRGRSGSDWLPDIYLNPHGYPSHEWVQQFAGYVPPGFRTYWSTRGWYTHDERAARSALSRARRRGRRALREQHRARDQQQRRRARDEPAASGALPAWAYGFAPYVFSQEIYKDTAIYYTDPETRRAARQRGAPARRGGGGGGGGGRDVDGRVAAGDVRSAA